MSVIGRYRTKFESMDERGQFKVTAIVIIISTLIFAAALLLSDFIMGAFDDISKSFSDVSHYYVNISEVLDKHLMPYSETPLEYPPFTLVVFAIPKLIAWGWPLYHVVYNLFAGAAYVGFAYFAYKILNKFGKDRYSLCIFILLLIIICNQMIFDRNDIFAVLFITLAFYLHLKDHDNWAAVMIACAAMIKIYPIIFVPVFMILFISKRQWSKALTFMVVSGLVCLLMELPFIIDNPSTAFSWVTYHSGRGLQAEAVISSFVMIANIFVNCIDSIYLDDSKSTTLHGAVPDAIASCMDTVLVIAMCLALVWMLYRVYKKRFTEQKDLFRILALMALMMVMTFITFSKVYSAQYSIWILTLVPFLILAKGTGDGKFYKSVIYYSIASFISQCVAWTIGSTPVDNLIAVIIFVKNVFHLYLFYQLIRMFIDFTSSEKDDVVSDTAPQSALYNKTN